MKPFLHPVPLFALLMAVGGAVLANYAVVAVALIVGIASIGFLSARHVQAERGSDPAESLSQESRGLIRPVQRLQGEIEAIVNGSAESPTLVVIGREAIDEAGRLVRQVARSLQIRDELKRSLRGRYEAEKEIGQSRMRMEFASEEERKSLQSAIDARTQELAHYVEIEAHVRQIEAGVNQAEAMLAEMKAKLSMSLSQDRAALGNSEDLRESLGRMRSLSDSYTEAEQLVSGREL
jgi:hypothetical protein